MRGEAGARACGSRWGDGPDETGLAEWDCASGPVFAMDTLPMFCPGCGRRLA